MARFFFDLTENGIPYPDTEGLANQAAAEDEAARALFGERPDAGRHIPPSRLPSP